MGSAMTKLIVEKLRDSGGVTILMALFALLVAAMVSMVILGAAVTAAKQAKGSQEQEQQTLALQSAGKLIAENICDTDKTWCKETKTQVAHYEDNSPATADDPTYEVDFSDNCLIGDELQTAMQAVLEGSREGTNAAGSGDFTITASSGEGAEDYEQTVNVHFDCYGKLQQESSFIVDNQLVFTLNILAEDNTVAQSLHLKMRRAETSTTTDTPHYKTSGGKDIDYVTTTTVRTYTWENPTFYVVEGVAE